MKNLVLHLLSISILLFSCNTNDSKNKETANQIIDTAQQKDTLISPPVLAINKQEDIVIAYESVMKGIENKTLDSSSFKFNCGGEKAGKIVFYREDGKLRLIEKTYNEYSHRDGKDQYFIINEKPFFIYKKTTDWAFDSNANVEGATTEKVNEYRYYIVKGKLANCLKKQYETSSVVKNKITPTENSNIDCPSLSKLLADYEILLSHQDQKEDIKCF